MVKKDFKKIAKIINSLHLESIILDEVIEHFADELLKDNPSFKEDKFIQACWEGR